MATYGYPTSRWAIPRRVEWALRQNVVLAASAFDGSVQAIELPGARWIARLDYPEVRPSERHALAAFWHKVAGPANKVTLWHHLHAAPDGTMRGSPTLKFSAALGATTLVIQTTAAATLATGDMIACGQQLFAVVVGGTADGGGALTVSVSPPVRSPINIGTAVTWDRPSGSFVTREPVYVPYEPARAPSFAVELVEVF